MSRRSIPNIFTCDAAFLMQFKEIGPKRAQKIINLRDAQINEEQFDLNELVRLTNIPPDMWNYWIRSNLLSLQNPNFRESGSRTSSVSHSPISNGSTSELRRQVAVLRQERDEGLRIRDEEIRRRDMDLQRVQLESNEEMLRVKRGEQEKYMRLQQEAHENLLEMRAEIARLEEANQGMARRHDEDQRRVENPGSYPPTYFEHMWAQKFEDAEAAQQLQLEEHRRRMQEEFEQVASLRSELEVGRGQLQNLLETRAKLPATNSGSVQTERGTTHPVPRSAPQTPEPVRSEGEAQLEPEAVSQAYGASGGVSREQHVTSGWINRMSGHIDSRAPSRGMSQPGPESRSFPSPPPWQRLHGQSIPSPLPQQRLHGQSSPGSQPCRPTAVSRGFTGPGVASLEHGQSPLTPQPSRPLAVAGVGLTQPPTAGQVQTQPTQPAEGSQVAEPPLAPNFRPPVPFAVAGYEGESQSLGGHGHHQGFQGEEVPNRGFKVRKSQTQGFKPKTEVCSTLDTRVWGVNLTGGLSSRGILT